MRNPSSSCINALAVAFAVVLLGLSSPAALQSQVGSTTDILTGKVTGPDGKPISGARVEATSVETGVTRSRTTSASGQYTILFPDGGGQYQMTVRFIGFAPSTFAVARQADEDRLVTDVRLSPIATQLAPVVVRSNANPGAQGDRPGPGSIERVLTGEQLARLPIDPTDPAALAALTPGVVGIGATDSTSATFSVAGQRPDQNQVTLDGLTLLAGGGVPQEAVRSTRVITNTYDVARGQFTGGQVATTTRGGTNALSGSFTYALRDPHLEWNVDDESSPTTFGRGYTQNQFSGGIGGPIVKNKAFYFGAFQVRRRVDPLQTIAGADALTLDRLGTQSDSAARFLDLVRGYGTPLEVSTMPNDRLSTSGNVLARFDYHLNDDHTLMLRGNWQGSWQEAFRTSALAVPSHGGTSRGGGGGAMVSLTSILGSFLNELRATYGRNVNAADPYLSEPEGRVRVSSLLADSTLGVNVLDFGGNSGLPTDGTNDQLEASDELSWMSDDASHRFKLGSLLNVTHFSSASAANRNGTFTFNSLEDFAANRPATYTRALTMRDRSGSALNAGLYLGDTWRKSRALQVTYGVRAEASIFGDRPAYNPEIESLFGRRTDRFPSEVHLSPRVGFTWSIGLPEPRTAGAEGLDAAPGGAARGGGRGRGGPGGFGGAGALGAAQPFIVRGGVGEFRGRSPTQLFQSAIDATGLPSAQTQLFCIGSAVPVPDWSLYQRDPSAVPSECANDDGTGTPPALSSQRPNVTVFDPDFGAPRSWRASLGVSRRVTRRLGVSLDVSYALGTNLYGVTDLNLDPVPRFRLTDEGNRPVFADALAIVPTTGAVSVLGSRRYDSYAQVLDVSSGLRSQTGQATLALNGLTTNDIIWNLAYTFMRSRDQTSFSGGNAVGGFGSSTTAGDPNALAWSTSDYERRHSLVGSMTWLVKPWLDVTSVLRFSSGAPFTPRVGSDINGDGARNDRAFVFDPDFATSSGDTAVANGMQRLLSSASGSVRDCLSRQVGDVAGRNSCTSSWTPSLDLQANFRPNFGGTLGRRLMISVSALNPLAGVDQLLHGSDNLHGWGQQNRADPTLLYVRGFDPQAQRFIYQVNERFGDNPASRSAIRTPFQLAVQARLQIGPDRQRELLEGTVRGINPGRGGQGGRRAFDVRTIVNRVAPNPVATILEMRDTLKLSAEQVSLLTAVADSLSAKNEVMITSLEEELAKSSTAADLPAVFANIQPRLQEARNNYLAAIKTAQGILTPVQWNMLPDAVRNPTLNRGMQRRMDGGRPPR